MMTALLVIGILVLLIVAHEFGHFIAAKVSGVRVEEFGVGYPPRAFLLGKIGETEYTLNWLPFGGFVRLFGDEGEKGRGPHSYIDASKRVQAAILVAGVLANALLAWLLFFGALSVGIPRLVETPRPGERTHLIVADVVSGSPADAGGVTAGDEIVELRDNSNAASALTPEALLDFISARGGRQLTLSYVRAAATSTVVLRPAHAVIADEADRPAVGVALVLVSDEPLSSGEAFKESFSRTAGAFRSVGSGLWHIVLGALRGSPNLSDIVGPVGLAGVVSDAAAHGLGSVLALAAFVSVNLAVINLIPIPALDGGRLALLAYEAVARRSPSHFAVRLLNLAGIILIALLMVVVTYHDIARLLA